YVDARIQQATANVLNQFLGPAYQPPAAPSSLAAAAVSSSQINLTWADNASNEAAYTVERSPNGSTGWPVVTPTLPANTTGYADTGLAAGSYSYRVRATNAVGGSPYSNVATGATAAQAAAPVVAAAGDIACDPTDLDYNGGLGQNGNCQQKATSD